MLSSAGKWVNINFEFVSRIQKNYILNSCLGTWDALYDNWGMLGRRPRSSSIRGVHRGAVTGAVGTSFNDYLWPDFLHVQPVVGWRQSWRGIVLVRFCCHELSFSCWKCLTMAAWLLKRQIIQLCRVFIHLYLISSVTITGYLIFLIGRLTGVRVVSS